MFRARLPNLDMGEIRAIQAKAKKTGSFRVHKLMKIQKGSRDEVGYGRDICEECSFDDYS